MSDEVALCAQAVDGLPLGHQLVAGDALPHALLHALDDLRGHYAGPVRLALVALLLAVGAGAVTQQGWGGREGGRGE